jgi:hypothetical protein
MGSFVEFNWSAERKAYPNPLKIGFSVFSLATYRL